MYVIEEESIVEFTSVAQKSAGKKTSFIISSVPFFLRNMTQFSNSVIKALFTILDFVSKMTYSWPLRTKSK